MNSTPAVRPFSLLALPLLLAGPALALQESATDSSDSWHWRVAPYLWTTSIDGTLTTPGAEVDVDASFDDIWDNLDSAGLILVEARRNQITLLSDFIYLGLEADGTTSLGAGAEVELDTTLFEFAGLYRLSPTSPVEFGAGVRFADFETDLDIGMVSSGSSRDSLDGFVAGRVIWPFAERWSASVYGDVGAGDSDLTWQASAMLGVDFRGWGLGFGYRILDYDLGESLSEVDLTFDGLVYGLEFRF
jgi:hypothetical protein